MNFIKLGQNRIIHKRVWSLAFPMILSNISVPLVGLVDTAVMGRLPNEHSMAAVGLGSGLYLFVVGCLNFLRMGTTGFTAQASGENNGEKLKQILIQTVILSLVLALSFSLIAIPFAENMLAIMKYHREIDITQGPVNTFYIDGAESFFRWRLWGLPAALLNFSLVGWFLGIQNARVPLYIMLSTNIVNVILSIVFVLILHKGVVGAAQAAVIAEWTGVIVGLCFIKKPLQYFNSPWSVQGLAKWDSWKAILFVNRDIFIRSLCLQLVFLLITLQGGRLGENAVAANMIILNGLLLTAYLLDGFAHAIESLCGYAIGARNRLLLIETLVVSGGWGLLISIIFGLGFFFGGKLFVDFLTKIESVREVAYQLMIYLVFLPLIGVWSYLFDGLFIGATRAKEMRNSMMLSLIIAIPLGIILHKFGVHGLWIAFLGFMALRGILLGVMGYQIEKREGWIATY